MRGLCHKVGSVSGIAGLCSESRIACIRGTGVKACYGKRRRDDVLPLKADLAQTLARWRDGKGKGDRTHRVFPSLPDKLAALPDLTPTSSQGELLKATGTCDGASDVKGKARELICKLTERETLRKPTMSCDGGDKVTTLCHSDKTLQNKAFCDDTRRRATQNVTEGAGNRTQGLRLKRPLRDSASDATASTYDNANPDTSLSDSLSTSLPPGGTAASAASGAVPAAAFLTAYLRDKDPFLTSILDAWPTLPYAVKAGIAATVQAVSKTSQNSPSSPDSGHGHAE